MSRPETRLFLNEPSREPARLLEVLLDATASVPAGESLSLAFYYLRNLRLCRELVAARRRGVDVRILTSGSTYLRDANAGALAFLRSEGLGDVLRSRHPAHSGRRRMHLKLFLASRSGDRRHVVLTGTYNPSGNDIAEPEIFEVIGDQDRGYNFLLELSGSQPLYAALSHYYLRLYEGESAPQRALRSAHLGGLGDLGVHTCPVRPNPFLTHLRALSRANEPARLRVAVSHISERRTVARLRSLAQGGHRIEVISHDSERRFPERIVRKLRDSGVRVRRYVHPERYPMHCKFVLSESRTGGVERRDLFLGSMNLNRKSYYRNDDLLFHFANDPLFADFDALWERIAKAIER